MDNIKLAYFNPCIYGMFNRRYQSAVDPEAYADTLAAQFAEGLNNNVIMFTTPGTDIRTHSEDQRIISPFHQFSIKSDADVKKLKQVPDGIFSLKINGPVSPSHPYYVYKIHGKDNTGVPFSDMNREGNGDIPVQELNFKINDNQVHALGLVYGVVAGTLEILELANAMQYSNILIYPNMLASDWRNNTTVTQTMLDIHLNAQTNADAMENYLIGLYNMPVVLAKAYGIDLSYVRK